MSAYKKFLTAFAFIMLIIPGALIAQENQGYQKFEASIYTRVDEGINIVEDLQSGVILASSIIAESGKFGPARAQAQEQIHFPLTLATHSFRAFNVSH